MSKESDHIKTHLILKYGSLDNVHQLWLAHEIELTDDERMVLRQHIADNLGEAMGVKDMDVEFIEYENIRHIELDIPLE